jgi:hypothetical protein
LNGGYDDDDGDDGDKCHDGHDGHDGGDDGEDGTSVAHLTLFRFLLNPVPVYHFVGFRQ